MPLEDLSQIDIVSKDADGRINLIITDAGITTDPEQRLELLRRKLALYVAAVAEGDLAHDYPDATIQDFVIRVVCMRRPSEQMLALTEACLAADEGPHIPVLYDEFPQGAWSTEPAPPEAETELVECTESETDAGQTPNVENDAIAGLSPLADLAFELAGKFLEEAQVPFFVFYVEGDERRLTPVEGCESAEDIWPWLRRWAASVPESVATAVFVCQGFLEVEDGERPVLLAHCFHRHQPEGLVLRRELKVSGPDGGLAPAGETSVHGSCEGVFLH